MQLGVFNVHLTSMECVQLLNYSPMIIPGHIDPETEQEVTAWASLMDLVCAACLLWTAMAGANRWSKIPLLGLKGTFSVLTATAPLANSSTATRQGKRLSHRERSPADFPTALLWIQTTRSLKVVLKWQGGLWRERASNLKQFLCRYFGFWSWNNCHGNKEENPKLHFVRLL